jgi:hypothetical protein
MTFKQLLRKLFAELWHRCAKLAEAKISSCYTTQQDQAAWWEEFITRCEKRAFHHSEFVPQERASESPAPFVPAVPDKPKVVDGLTCIDWIRKYRNEKHCSLKEAKDEWDKRSSSSATPRSEA